MATHKELSNFTNEKLSEYRNFELKIAKLKADLTVEQANMSVPQSIADKLDKLYDQYPEAPKPKNYIISVILESLLVAIAEKISDVLSDQALKIITEFLNNFVL